MLCEVRGAARSSYYLSHHKTESTLARENRELTERILVIHRENKERHGAPKIHQTLRRQGIRLSIKRVQRLMEKAGISSIIQKNCRLVKKANVSLMQNSTSVEVVIVTNHSLPKK
jgi:putative transposase